MTERTWTKEDEEKLRRSLDYRDAYGSDGIPFGLDQTVKPPNGLKAWEIYGDPAYLTEEQKEEIRKSWT